MYNLIKADLFKLYKSKMIRILFAIMTLCAVIMAIIAYNIAQGQMAGAGGIGFLFSDVNVISILGAVVAGTIISGDFDNKTIHDAIACGYSRSSIIISKAVVFFCAIAFLLLPYAIVTVVAIGSGATFSIGSAALGFLNLLMQENGTAFSVEVGFKLFFIMLVLVVVYIAQLSICIPLAIALKKPVLVVAVFYVISICSGQLSALNGTYPMFDKVYSMTPYGGIHSLLTLHSGGGDIFKAIVVSMSYIVVMLVIAYRIFKKLEIK